MARKTKGTTYLVEPDRPALSVVSIEVREGLCQWALAAQPTTSYSRKYIAFRTEVRGDDVYVYVTFDPAARTIVARPIYGARMFFKAAENDDWTELRGFVADTIYTTRDEGGEASPEELPTPDADRLLRKVFEGEV